MQWTTKQAAKRSPVFSIHAAKVVQAVQADRAFPLVSIVHALRPSRFAVGC